MSQANRLNLPSASAKQQSDNKWIWNDARSAHGANFFTIGYTGGKIQEIIATLQQNGVRTLVDIRQNAVSMYRPEMCKANLAKILQEHGLLYAHLPKFSRSPRLGQSLSFLMLAWRRARGTARRRAETASCK